MKSSFLKKNQNFFLYFLIFVSIFSFINTVSKGLVNGCDFQWQPASLFWDGINHYQKFIKTYKDLVKDENCVQQFTDDNAIPYLVNKPTCTKYYVNAHIIQNWTEENFIEELKYTNPNYIVYSSKINWFKSRNNAPNADKYILDNYYLFKDLSPWLIYKKN